MKIKDLVGSYICEDHIKLVKFVNVSEKSVGKKVLAIFSNNNTKL